MHTIKIALRNVGSHGKSSRVIFLIFLIISLVMFWVFGFANTVSSGVGNFYRALYGDIYISSVYADKAKIESLLKPLGAKTILAEDVPVAMLDFKKHSAVELLRSFDGPKDQILTYLQVSQGRLPKGSDEIMVPESFVGKDAWQGQTMVVTISTPDKVVNTGKFHIVGLCKMYFFVPKEAIKLLSNGDSQANSIKLFFGSSIPSRAFIEPAYERAKALLQGAGMSVKDESFQIYKQVDRLNVFIIIFRGIQALLMAIIFPLAGSVLGAMVWMAANKRRREIWTYVAIGWKDVKLRRLFSLEFWIITLAGIVAGTLLGYASSFVLSKAKVWMDFGNLFASPLVASVGPLDIGIYSIFLMALSSLWIGPPLNKIMREKLFSY